MHEVPQLLSANMNEAQLVANTTEIIKTGGWVRNRLVTDDGRHCILGAIGKARWGHQWDMDCMTGMVAVCKRLGEDPVASAVVRRVREHLVASHQQSADRWTVLSHCAEGEYPGHHDQTVVYQWNDYNTNYEELLDVLGKVQAEVGLPHESF